MPEDGSFSNYKLTLILVMHTGLRNLDGLVAESGGPMGISCDRLLMGGTVIVLHEDFSYGIEGFPS